MRFHEAGARALTLASEAAAALRTGVTVVRDLRGVLHVIVDDRAAPAGDEVLARIADQWREQLGPYAPGSREDTVFRATSFHDFGALTRDAIVRAPDVAWLERTAVPWDWCIAEAPGAGAEPPGPRRIVFYGIKGGVGRSTALAVVALHLARAGRRVLVVDLDLESPGIGPLLVESALAEAGVVDWLTEDLVGNADEGLRRGLVHRASVEGTSTGELWIAPAAGSVAPEAYIDKLARICRRRWRSPIDTCSRVSPSGGSSHERSSGAHAAGAPPGAAA